MVMDHTRGWHRDEYSDCFKEICGHRYEIERLRSRCYILFCDGGRVGFPGAWEKLSDAKIAAHGHAEGEHE